jgi:hypothetical protein
MIGNVVANRHLPYLGWEQISAHLAEHAGGTASIHHILLVEGTPVHSKGLEQDLES